MSLVCILKRLVSVFFNASRRCPKLNENFFSLLEFENKGDSDVLKRNHYSSAISKFRGTQWIFSSKCLLFRHFFAGWEILKK